MPKTKNKMAGSRKLCMVCLFCGLLAVRCQAKNKIPLKQLAGVDLLMREVGSGKRQATLEFLAAHHMAPRIRMTLGSNEAVKHAVAAGLGLAIMSRHAIALYPAHDGLCVLPVTHLPIQRSWQMV